MVSADMWAVRAQKPDRLKREIRPRLRRKLKYTCDDNNNDNVIVHVHGRNERYFSKEPIASGFGKKKIIYKLTRRVARVTRYSNIIL